MLPFSRMSHFSTSMDAQAIAEEIATDELHHVVFLRTALGAAAVPCPATDIGSAFATAADAALNMTLNPPFSCVSCKPCTAQCAEAGQDLRGRCCKLQPDIVTDNQTAVS